LDLICYTYEGWEPRIRPATAQKDWMENSPERFAYRCLPLAIANSHGWEILSPCGFSARWNGGSGVEAVEIRVDPETDPRRAPVSLFGLGTITFHVEGILRTPPGWNLWIGGPPNAARDGIAALNAVVETDWSPYTFTMNWRFTRPDHWVRFEEGDPICFFFPIQRSAVADAAPKVLPIEAEPDLKHAFEEWSRSRDAFQQWVRDTQPIAPADKWQKLYYRGMRPDGCPGAADHQSKLRPKAFAGLTVPEPSRVSARGVPDIPVEADQPAEPASSAADSLALRRRDWLLGVQARQRRLSHKADAIPRAKDLSSEAFLTHFYAPGRPVLIEGELADWPALARWTPDYLAERIGAAEIQFQSRRSANGTFELEKDRHVSRMPFDRFIETIVSTPGNDVYLTAFNSGQNWDALAPLEDDIRPLSKFLKGGRGMPWIGPIGTFTPLHFDLTNNLIVQVKGSKKIILLAPSETQYLYNHRHVFSDVHDVMDETSLVAHPLASKVHFHEVDLQEGEILYVPIGWWHQVTSLDFSVTYTFTDFLWDNDFHADFPAD